jgi:hypothetical protein
MGLCGMRCLSTMQAYITLKQDSLAGLMLQKTALNVERLILHHQPMHYLFILAVPCSDYFVASSNFISID